MSKVLDIMFCYVDGYHNYFSGRELAKKLKISPQTALNHLKGLVKDKILSTDVRGKSIFYSLNLSNFATLTLLKIKFKTPSGFLV